MGMRWTGQRYRFDRIGNVVPDRRTVESHTEERREHYDPRTRKMYSVTVGVVRFRSRRSSPARRRFHGQAVPHGKV